MLRHHPRRRVFVLTLLLVLGLSGGAIVARQPFSAQIQLALQTLGLWPYGVYANNEIPVWNATTNMFEPGTGGGLQTGVNIEEVGGVAIGSTVPVSGTVTAQSGPCQTGTKVYLPISQAASTELFTGTASNRTHVCSIAIIQKAASTQTWSLVSGTGSVCATSTSAMLGGTTAANGTDLSVSQGNGASVVLKTDTDADNVCLLQSSTDRLNGNIAYVVAANQ